MGKNYAFEVHADTYKETQTYMHSLQSVELTDLYILEILAALGG